VIQRNVFVNSGGLSVGFSEGRDVSILNNLFIGPSTTGYWVESWASYGGQLEVHNNEFRGGPYIAVQLKPDYKDAKISATANFWGSQSLADISKMVNDRSDSLSYVNTIDISGPLSAAALGTPTNSILQADKATQKPAADKKAAENVTLERLNIISDLEARLARMFEASPELQGKILPTWSQVIKVKNLDLTMSDQIFQQTISPLIKQIQALERIKTITCKKGKATKKVKGINPKCPTGYRKAA
jgi:hypothetical protein